jgi:methyltransferase (TIGR00027 family)
MPTDTPVSHISDTARWVAVYRAMESERPDALFRDPYARKLAGAEGEAILSGMKKGRQFAWPMIVRTAVMDEVIERCVNREGYDAVMNLAAGLDTRPYRLDLPGNVRWFDVDLPDVVDYKQTQLSDERPHCSLEFAKADLTDAGARGELFQRVGTTASKVLVITEGLLVYLSREQVAELARDLHDQPTFNGWLIDLASPRLLKMMQRTWGKQLERGQAPLVFAPAEGTGFFEPCGWKEVEYRSMFEEATRLKRTMKLAWLWSFLGRLYPKKKQEEFRRMSGVVLLARS